MEPSNHSWPTRWSSRRLCIFARSGSSSCGVGCRRRSASHAAPHLDWQCGTATFAWSRCPVAEDLCQRHFRKVDLQRMGSSALFSRCAASAARWRLLTLLLRTASQQQHAQQPAAPPRETTPIVGGCDAHHGWHHPGRPIGKKCSGVHLAPLRVYASAKHAPTGTKKVWGSCTRSSTLCTASSTGTRHRFVAERRNRRRQATRGTDTQRSLYPLTPKAPRCR